MQGSVTRLPQSQYRCFSPVKQTFPVTLFSKVPHKATCEHEIQAYKIILLTTQTNKHSIMLRI